MPDQNYMYIFLTNSASELKIARSLNDLKKGFFRVHRCKDRDKVRVRLICSCTLAVY